MILFVGDRPSKRTHPTIAFKGAASEQRLKAWISFLSHADEFVKVINRTDHQFELILVLAQQRNVSVVALGNEASKALKSLSVSHYKLPHPSGRNRKINDESYVNQKLSECKQWLNTRG